MSDYVKTELSPDWDNRRAQIAVCGYLLPVWQRISEAETAAVKYDFAGCRAQMELARKGLNEAFAALDRHTAQEAGGASTH